LEPRVYFHLVRFGILGDTNPIRNHRATEEGQNYNRTTP
jgi:hypothetical protein